MGRLQFSQSRLAQFPTSAEIQIPLNTLAAGRYRLEVLQDKRQYRQAVLIE